MEPKYIKPSEYAKIMSMHVLTVRKHFHKGLIKGKQDPETGTIKLLNPLYKGENETADKRAILYARVSSTTNKKSLDGQLQRLENYASAKGYTIVDEVTEIASGLNDHRTKFTKILNRSDYNILLAEHKDRITRFGYNYLDVLLKRLGVTLEIVNQADTKDNELMDDFVSLVTSFCNRIYGRRRKDKTNQIIKDITNEKEKKKKTDKIVRSFQSKAPAFIKPIYQLLQTVLNNILANPKYAKQFISLKLTKINDKGNEVNKQRGKLWREIQAITGNPLTGLINNASWYMRILEANILSLIKSHQQQVEIYKILKAHSFVIDQSLHDELAESNYYPSSIELQNLAKAKEIPDMPDHSVLKLNYAFADKQLFTMDDNQLCSLQTMSKAKAKQQGVSDRKEFQLYLPSFLRNKNIVKICKPVFIYNKKINQIMCQVPYIFKPVKHRHMTNVLGVDLGKVKFYSATVLYQNNHYSDEYVPSLRLDHLNKQLAKLNSSINCLYNKIQRAKNNPNLNSKLQERRYLEYTNSREKRTRLREQIEWLMADELIDIAIKQHCKEIHLENLTWVNNIGGKWDFAMVAQHIRYVAEMHSITVKLVDCKNTSKRHPITKELGIFSKRNVVFNDITVDRDQLASLNIALEQSGQEITDFHKRKSVRTHLKSRRKQNYNAKKQVLGFKGDTQIVVFLHDTVKHILTFMQLNKNTCDLDNNLVNRKDMVYIRPYELV